LLLCVLVGCLDRTISISSRIALTFVDPYDISLLNQSLSFLFLIFLQSEPRVSSLVSSFLPFFPLSRLLFRSSLFVSLSLASSRRLLSLSFSSLLFFSFSCAFTFFSLWSCPAPAGTPLDHAARSGCAAIDCRVITRDGVSSGSARLLSSGELASTLASAWQAARTTTSACWCVVRRRRRVAHRDRRLFSSLLFSRLLSLSLAGRGPGSESSSIETMCALVCHWLIGSCALRLGPRSVCLDLDSKSLKQQVHH
jgi:hypothetical protein